MPEIGVTLRNMGHQSSREMMRAGVMAAESLGFESIWITDHIAIPPDDAEGSGGRYTDPLTTLAWLGGLTTTIRLGVGVLIIPYRQPLPTAKQIATVQELTDHRLLLGCAVGWMDAEFRALGVNRHQRGKITDETLAYFRDCFSNDVMQANGQPFLFKPNPPMPPVYIGGSAPHALKRAVKFGHGWMPMVQNVDKLKADLVEFQRLAEAGGVTPGPVTVMTGAGPDVAEKMAAFEELGIERVVVSVRYDTADEYQDKLRRLADSVNLSSV